MGVTDNRRNIYFSQNSLGRNGETSSEEEGWEIINGGSTDESPPPTPAPVIVYPQRNPLPAKKKRPTCGHKLVPKKGRRSMHRYTEERNLFQSYLDEDANTDEAPEGWDIGYPDSKSHFTSLLNASNEMLLDDFVNDCETVEMMVKAVKRKQWKNSRLRKDSVDDDSYNSSLEDDVDNPEQAFLSISQNLRHAFKKHLPLGMLEGLENQIREIFTANPDTEYITSDLSSYERLLVHAASSYNQLHSRSFDKNGKRILMVQNRNKYKTFRPVDPSLSKYLKIRSRKDLD